MRLGFTADQDNADLPDTLLAGFRTALDTVLHWRVPDTAEEAAFELRAELRQKADSLYAVTESFGNSAWVLKNMWHGFPDPAEFLFVGFDGQGDIRQMGYFEDWPSWWHRKGVKNNEIPT